MKKRMSRAIVLVLFCLLIMLGLSSRSTATPPPCPDCEYWSFIEERCIPYGDCWGGCTNCKTCVDCWCRCLAECCFDAHCSGCCKCSGCQCVDDTPSCFGGCYACIGCGCIYQCDPDNCQICVDNVCENRCTQDPASCDECDGVGNCVSACDPNTQVCCDGTCTDKCENTEPTGHCDTSHNGEYQCVGCVGVPPFTSAECGDFEIRVYTGNINHHCTGGCPGDCQEQDPVHCYTMYECWPYSEQESLCILGGESTICFPAGELLTCLGCKKKLFDDGEPEYVTHWACQ